MSDAAWIQLATIIVAGAVAIFGKKKLDASAEKLDTIHLLVNNRLDESLMYAKRLEARLGQVGSRSDDLKEAPADTPMGTPPPPPIALLADPDHPIPVTIVDPPLPVNIVDPPPPEVASP